MARKKIAENLDEDEPGLDISSLIDVCFLLLIYFLVTTTIQPREQDLSLELPSVGSTSGAMDIAPMLIRLRESGAISINGGDAEESLDTDISSRELPMLKTRLDTYVNGFRASGKEPVVQVWTDGEAVQQRVIDVLNCIASAEVRSVTFTNLVDRVD